MLNLEEYLKNSFSKFQHEIHNSDKFREECRKLYIDYHKKNSPNETKKISGGYFPFIIIEIKNNQILVKNDYHVDHAGRIQHMISLLKKTIEHYKTVPNPKLYFWVSDRVPWELGNYMEKYPFFVYAKPKNVNNIIFPDNTFECITLQKKYEGKCFDWDYMKKLFEKKNKEYVEKQKIIYFKGTAYDSL